MTRRKPQPKPWYQSKTLWLNLLVIALSAADLLSQVVILPAGHWGVIIGLLNITLRVVSGQPLSLLPRQPLLPDPVIEPGGGDGVSEEGGR